MKILNDSIIDLSVMITNTYWLILNELDEKFSNMILIKIKLKEIEESNHCINFEYSIFDFKNISDWIKTILLEIENYYDINGVILNNVDMIIEIGYGNIITNRINKSLILNCDG